MAKKTNLVGYCGTCPPYTQVAANLARDLRKELRRGKFDKAAPTMAKIPAFKSFKYYDKAYDFLGTIMEMCCKKACREGGGGPNCPIRKCAKAKGFYGYWLCDSFETCKNLKGLE